MTEQTSSRRAFLRTLTSAVGGTATLAVAANVVNAAPVQEKVDVPKSTDNSKGYQRTAHVDTYYTLADF